MTTIGFKNYSILSIPYPDLLKVDKNHLKKILEQPLSISPPQNRVDQKDRRKTQILTSDLLKALIEEIHYYLKITLTRAISLCWRESEVKEDFREVRYEVERKEASGRDESCFIEAEVETERRQLSFEYIFRKKIK